MLTEKEVVESSGLTSELVGRRYKVRLIEGDRLGSTGYYPAEMLKRDGPKIFTKGTPMYLDHLSPAEKAVRPHGSVLNYAAELAEDAYYEDDGLYADIEVFEHQIPLIKSLKDKIGISIRARGKVTDTVIAGKTVPVFQELNKARSVDFVVRAGAGGRIVQVLESATEDSESASDEEKGREIMEQKEILDAITALRDDFGKRLTDVEEALKPVEEVKDKKTEIDSLEVAEQLASSSLSVEGRKRVVELHRATGKALPELIEAEESYIKKAAESAAEVEGNEEGHEAEESAKDNEPEFKLPSRWTTKKDN